MRSLLIGAAFLICVPAHAQEASEPGSLIERLNEAVGAAQSADPAEPDPVVPLPTNPDDDTPDVTISPMDESAVGELRDFRTLAAGLPNYGVIVRDQSGEVVQVFGDVEYRVIDGSIEVPGYEPPPGSRLEVVPQTEYIALASASDLDARFQPLSAIPGAVQVATAFLAQELCAKKGRPTAITLSLVVNASGSIGIISAGTQAGSSVSWDFHDVCIRNGLEGEGIQFE